MSNICDHRDLISLYNLGHIEQHSPGLIHWHPSGMVVLDRLSDWILDLHKQKKYQQVKSPIILSQHLWEQSGHWEKYQDLMFVSSDDDSKYAVKPMSCPGHISIYSHKRRSWRELPFRMFELGHVHRKEPSGALSGWMRLRGFVQDDSHVICKNEDISSVIHNFIQMVEHAYKSFGFDKWQWKLSLRPENRHGSDDVWNKAENALREVCKNLGIVPVEAPGDGAFYGPKLEVALEDRLGRQWQCGVAQLDFVLPERFNLSYQNDQGKNECPVMVHHAVLGSLERWLSIVMEHCGELPKWLSPHQVVIHPISQDQSDVAYELAEKLVEQGLSCEVMEHGPLPGRIRSASEMKFVHQVIIGKREKENGQVSVRDCSGKSNVMDSQEWIAAVVNDLKKP